MFSFHKPKIYRSLKGCCICRAKSSSSRFTDSKRYEPDFDKCFMLMEVRTGEICNACVLLVKRWKKLPVGSTRNWHHVVDARAGPGTKSIMKMKSRNKEERKFKKKHKHKKLRPSVAKVPFSPGGLSDDIMDGDDCGSSDEGSGSTSPIPSDLSDEEGSVRIKKDRPGKSRRKKSNPVRFSSFLDLTYWKKTEICCGIIFKGANGEVLVDTKLLHPCRTCKPVSKANSETSSDPSTPEVLEDSQEPLPLTAPATPQDMDTLSMFVEPPVLDRADTVLDRTDTVLDLSMPISQKTTPDMLQQQPMCIAMEV